MLLTTVTVLTCLSTNQGSRHKITRSRCILHWHILRERKNVFLQKNVLVGVQTLGVLLHLDPEYMPFSYSMWWNWKYTQDTSMHHSWTSHFSMAYQFYSKWLQKNCGCSSLGIWQTLSWKWIKCTSHMKETTDRWHLWQPAHLALLNKIRLLRNTVQDLSNERT